MGLILCGWPDIGSTADLCPPNSPVPLVERPVERVVSLVDGKYTPFFKGAVTGKWLLLHNSDFMTLEGIGYLRVRLEIEYWFGRGELDETNFSNVEGSLIHVASGGGRKVDDKYPSKGDESMLGRPEIGFSRVKSSIETPWFNEYFYLEGRVTLSLREGRGYAYINYAVTPVTWQDIVSDLQTPVNASKMWLRSGLVRDRCRKADGE